MDYQDFPFPHAAKEPSSEAGWFSANADLARYLRGPEGCPWDRDHGPLDFAKFAKEEAEELVEAIEVGAEGHPAEELGDALFCLLAVAAAAEEQGLFTLEEALRMSHEKMIRRHEHVFGEKKAESAQDAIDSWERIKAEEKKQG